MRRTLVSTLLILFVTNAVSAIEIETHKIHSIKGLQQQYPFEQYDLLGETQGRSIMLIDNKGSGPQLKIQSRTNARYYLHLTPNKKQSQELISFIKKNARGQSCALQYSIAITQEKEAKFQTLDVSCT